VAPGATANSIKIGLAAIALPYMEWGVPGSRVSTKPLCASLGRTQQHHPFSVLPIKAKQITVESKALPGPDPTRSWYEKVATA